MKDGSLRLASPGSGCPLPRLGHPDGAKSGFSILYIPHFWPAGGTFVWEMFVVYIMVWLTRDLAGSWGVPANFDGLWVVGTGSQGPASAGLDGTLCATAVSAMPEAGRVWLAKHRPDARGALMSEPLAGT